MIKDVAVDGYVKHELGYVSILPDERSVADTEEGRVTLVASVHRLPGSRIDVLTRAESRPQGRGPRVRAEDGDSVMDVRRVSS